MLHRLLACLALLTGLTLAGAPAHARDGGVIAAQVEQGASVAAACMVTASCRGDVHAKDFADARQIGDQLTFASTSYRPTVELGVDRALE